MLIYYDIKAAGEFDVVEPVTNIEPVINFEPDVGKEADREIDPDMKIDPVVASEVLVGAAIDAGAGVVSEVLATVPVPVVVREPDINIGPATATFCPGGIIIVCDLT